MDHRTHATSTLRHEYLSVDLGDYDHDHNHPERGGRIFNMAAYSVVILRFMCRFVPVCVVAMSSYCR